MSPAAAVVDRTPVDVAVGVLVDADGRFLLTSRPAGKVWAGHWEFPGGKVEPGESVDAALRRELREELGIEIGAAVPWQVELVDYPHALVRLHFCKVFSWTGEPQMLEQQSMAWQTLPVTVAPVLPGTVPVLRWFAAERGFGGATHADAGTGTRWLDDVRWGDDGLVPVIAQERASNDVLMFAFMNRAALAETVRSGEAVYWSRSRGRLWHKGEASGHTQTVHDIRMDCDNDVLLLTVTQNGHLPAIACHTGRHSCFFRRFEDGAWRTTLPVLKDPEDIYPESRHG